MGHQDATPMSHWTYCPRCGRTVSLQTKKPFLCAICRALVGPAATKNTHLDWPLILGVGVGLIVGGYIGALVYFVLIAVLSH